MNIMLNKKIKLKFMYLIDSSNLHTRHKFLIDCKEHFCSHNVVFLQQIFFFYANLFLFDYK